MNDTLIMVTLKDGEFSSVLVSVLGLREAMLSHKDLHAVPCWVCLYLSSVASSCPLRTPENPILLSCGAILKHDY